MWLTLLSSLIGLLSSALPSFIRYLERRQEITYELENFRLKIDAAIKGLEIEREIENAQAASTGLQGIVDEGRSLREHDMSLSSGSWVETLRASIRPVITYTFFFLFIIIKLMVAIVFINTNSLNIDNVKIFAEIIFDESTLALFGAIISFWFGTRAFEKADQVINKTYKVNKEK